MPSMSNINTFKIKKPSTSLEQIPQEKTQYKISLIRMTSVQLISMYLQEKPDRYRNNNHAVNDLLNTIKSLTSNQAKVINNMLIIDTCEDNDFEFSDQILETRNFKYLSKILFTALENRIQINNIIEKSFIKNSDTIYALLYCSLIELKYLKTPLLIAIKEYTNIGFILGLENKYIHYIHAFLSDMYKKIV
ncbi:MAG: transcription antitermination factor NusB [Pseudomonadota bacterium]